MTLLVATRPNLNLRVKEVDGAPDVPGVSVVVVSNGTLTNDGGGQVTLNTSGTTLPVVDETALVFKTGSPAITATLDANSLTVARTYALPNASGTLLTTVFQNDVDGNTKTLSNLFQLQVTKAPTSGAVVIQGLSPTNTLKVQFKESGTEVASYEWDSIANLVAFRGIKANSAVKFTSSNQDRLYISGGGLIGIGTGTVTPSGKLHVDQADPSGTIPVLILDQADIDQPTTKIIGTSSPTSTDRTLIKASDYPTPGSIVAWEMIEIQDDRAGGITAGKYYRPIYSAPS